MDFNSIDNLDEQESFEIEKTMVKKIPHKAKKS